MDEEVEEIKRLLATNGVDVHSRTLLERVEDLSEWANEVFQTLLRATDGPDEFARRRIRSILEQLRLLGLRPSQDLLDHTESEFYSFIDGDPRLREMYSVLVQEKLVEVLSSRLKVLEDASVHRRLSAEELRQMEYLKAELNRGRKGDITKDEKGRMKREG